MHCEAELSCPNRNIAANFYQYGFLDDFLESLPHFLIR
jgi:hypothetical protein